MRKFWQVIAVAFTVMIIYLSLVNLKEVTDIRFNISDKILHAGSYFVMTLVWFFAFTWNKRGSFSFHEILDTLGILKFSYAIPVAVFLLGITLEFAQGQLTTVRMADAADAFANTIGILLAWLMLYVYRKRTDSLRE